MNITATSWPTKRLAQAMRHVRCNRGHAFISGHSMTAVGYKTEVNVGGWGVSR